jgi:hypothetical protein
VGVRREKMYKLDDHVACAVAGITGGSFPMRMTILCWHMAASLPCFSMPIAESYPGTPVWAALNQMGSFSVVGHPNGA